MSRPDRRSGWSPRRGGAVSPRSRGRGRGGAGGTSRGTRRAPAGAGSRPAAPGGLRRRARSRPRPPSGPGRSPIHRGWGPGRRRPRPPSPLREEAHLRADGVEQQVVGLVHGVDADAGAVRVHHLDHEPAARPVGPRGEGDEAFEDADAPGAQADDPDGAGGPRPLERSSPPLGLPEEVGDGGDAARLGGDAVHFEAHGEVQDAQAEGEKTTGLSVPTVTSALITSARVPVMKSRLPYFCSARWGRCRPSGSGRRRPARCRSRR